MQRLTNSKTDKAIETLNKYQFMFDKGTEFCSLLDALERLKAYESTGLEPEEISPFNKELVKSFLEIINNFEDLEKQGLLTKYPCKPNTKVYQIYTKFIDGESIRTIKESLLIKFGKSQYHDFMVFKEKNYEYSVILKQFGRTVFLTQEEAENVLKDAEV